MLVFSHARVAAQFDFVSSADGALENCSAAERVPARDMAVAFVKKYRALCQRACGLEIVGRRRAV